MSGHYQARAFEAAVAEQAATQQPQPEIVGNTAAALTDQNNSKEKHSTGLKAPAKVMVYHEAWDHIDLEGQHEAAAPVSTQPKGFRHWAWLQQSFWSRRRLGLVLLLLLLAVLALAMGLGIGLGTTAGAAKKGASSHPGKSKSPYKPRPGGVVPAPPRKVSAAEAGDAAQLASLMQLKAALDPDGVLDKVWTKESGRNRGYCKWKYVGCDKAGEVVEKVNLTTDSYVMVLTGQLPPAAAFAGLPGLREIDIRMNALKGGLPEDWSALGGQLEVIRLDQNFLNGTLPDAWADLGPSLKELTLWDNDLSGPLPESFADLVVLESLDLSYNGFEGPLPEAWASMGSKGTGLKELLIDVNQLTGPLPEAYGALTSLERLLVSENHLEGPLPDVGDQWANMRELWAEYNGFSGPLPDSWGKMVHLEKLALNDNAFTGTVPASYASLKSLADLYLYNNPGLTGCVPASLKGQLEVSPGFSVDDFVLDATKLEGFC